MSRFTIHDLQKCDRPRERLKELGPDSVSSTELIAIILGSGTKGVNVLELSQELLCRFGSVRKLAEASIEEICQVKGMGNAKAIQLKAALTLGKRMKKEKLYQEQKIQTAEDAYFHLKEDIENEQREMVIALFLDAKSCLIRKEIISIGTLTSSILHARELFYAAIKNRACSMIIAHNHPSGDPTPSKADLEITRSLITCGQVMGIPLCDHIIIGKGTYTSIREPLINEG